LQLISINTIAPVLVRPSSTPTFKFPTTKYSCIRTHAQRGMCASVYIVSVHVRFRHLFIYMFSPWVATSFFAERQRDCYMRCLIWP
jgi:hypothetical protein